MNVLTELNKAIDKAGNQVSFARANDISTAYVNDVVRGRKEPGDKILSALGLERVITYRKKAAK